VPQLRITRLGRSEVVNVINLRWARRAWVERTADGAYARTTPGRDLGSIADYGEIETSDLDRFKYDFVTSETMAQSLNAFELERNALPDARRIKVVTPLTKLAVIEGDVMDFGLGGEPFGPTPTSPFGSSPSEVFGGGAGPQTGDEFDGLVPGNPFEVEAKTQRADMSLEFVLREL
jgi:hypothetical protein